MTRTRVGKGGRTDISGDSFVDVGFGGCGGVGIKIRTVENFAETGDAAIPAMPTPTSNVCGAES